jgi:RNA polymerase sigma-70 factor (ECF subfamily)
VIDLERFRRGDRGYLEELVTTHGGLVLQVAQGFGKDSDHVQDLFQEAWMHVFQKRRTYRGEGSFEAWLHRTATRVCVTDFRLRKARFRVHDRMGQEERGNGQEWRENDPMDENDKRETHAKLHRALGELSNREHEAICLRVLEKKKTEEVARIMGIKQATVRSIIRHGVSRLRKLMEAPGDELPGYP